MNRKGFVQNFYGTIILKEIMNDFPSLFRAVAILDLWHHISNLLQMQVNTW